jgi:hypothetical protein
MKNSPQCLGIVSLPVARGLSSGIVAQAVNIGFPSNGMRTLIGGSF